MLTSYIRVGGEGEGEGAEGAGGPALPQVRLMECVCERLKEKVAKQAKRQRKKGRGIGKGQKKTTKQQNGEFKRLSFLVLLLFFSCVLLGC